MTVEAASFDWNVVLSSKLPLPDFPPSRGLVLSGWGCVSPALSTDFVWHL